MMLGAQARAAEYNAAKNASARQANREAEEQKLPPKPAPISLSAFTRNVQVNRNKGNKNWVPLVLEDGGEDEEAQLDESDNSTTSSKEQSTKLEPKHPTPSDPQSDSANRIRVNMPKAVVPIAPRAMRFQGQPAMHMNPLPGMPYPQPVPNDNGGIIPTALYTGNPGPQTVSMFPYPQYGWMSSLPMLDYTGHVTDGTPECMRRYSGMMVPMDITPTKQEQKLSILSQTHHNPLYAIPDTYYPAYDEAVPRNAVHVQPQYHELSGMVLGPAWDTDAQPLQTAVPSILRRLEPQHVHSDLTPEPKTAIFDPQPSLARHASLPEANANPVTPPRAVNGLRTLDAQSSIKSKENEELYDRTSKMQKFIAAQQAVAKTGKTVLNNPDLRKNQEVKMESNLDEDKVTAIPSNIDGATLVGTELMQDSRPRTAPKIPPGFGDVKPKPGFDDLESAIATGPEDASLRNMFGVGAEDWLELKPVTQGARRKMLNVMSFVALDMEGEIFGSTSAKDPERMRTIKGWLYSDPRGLQGARKEVDEIASDYSARLRDGDPAYPEENVDSNEIDIHSGLVRGAGNILANLTEYIMEDKSEHTPRDYFSRTKPAPDFAVERGGLGANLSGLSLFEDEGSGFYNPPNRIARDPRFRPQTKEGVKVKTDDEWTLRHEAYSRGGLMDDCVGISG